MFTDQTRNVFLTAEQNAFIHCQAASGWYQNASEVVRAGLWHGRNVRRKDAVATRGPHARPD